MSAITIIHAKLSGRLAGGFADSRDVTIGAPLAAEAPAFAACTARGAQICNPASLLRRRRATMTRTPRMAPA